MSPSKATLAVNETIGESIPPDTPHAVSVSLPTWRSNVGYEEGEAWVVQRMKCGYPRFFIDKKIVRLSECIVSQYGSPEIESAMLFPTRTGAVGCKDWIARAAVELPSSAVRILDFVSRPDHHPDGASKYVQPKLSAVIYPTELFPRAKEFWQHTGEGISSRQAEFCQQAFDDKILVESNAINDSSSRLTKGPKRYQRPVSVDKGVSNGVDGSKATVEATTNGLGVHDSAQFVEERFGRNLDVSFAAQAKLAIRKRIAGSLTNDEEIPASLEKTPEPLPHPTRDVPGFSDSDVYLYPRGMNAIYYAHKSLMAAYGEKKSVMFGFPYVDTLKILEKFGPGAVFYGHGDASDLDALEKELESGSRFLSLFCEFPGNPLLKTPDLRRIRTLADKYDFAVVVDETIGNFLNVHVLPYADVVVSSLTKVFSGDSNVMGGAMILNPSSRYYAGLKDILGKEYEDTQFEEDSVYLERNSRDFVVRSRRINHNAEVIADTLRAHPRVKQVNYPKYSDSKHLYDVCRLPDGGYGGLLSATFHSVADAEIFFDHLDTNKGPSLGTNFTLSSPFVLLAHYNELDWAAQYGCEKGLVRFSVGLEDTEALKAAFEFALAAIPKA